MDGFCHKDPGTCAAYSYVYKSDVQPYFDIATNYGYANYMFQTNQGPSFEAHQFLFTGTSAPVAPNDSSGYGIDFVADNAIPDTYSGCSVNSGSYPNWALPNGAPENSPTSNECYTHDSLVTAGANCPGCDRGEVSWAYFAPTPNFIWTAPAAIPEVCYGQNSLADVGQACGYGSYGSEWTNHVGNYLETSEDMAPIFDALYKCTLPQVSWVIPDLKWSDHGGETEPYGPSFVGDIIDAVGGGMSGSTCNGANSGKYWSTEPTAILLVWDDWGGWFDHINPSQNQYPGVYESPNSTSCPTNIQPNNWGCGYTYGFRVPFLAISEYTKAGTISGACGGTGNPSCPNNAFPYVHDFGSILAFTEYNFGMQTVYPDTTIYADVNAPDNRRGNVPLSEFFNLPINNPRAFTSIATEEPYCYFQNKCQYDPSWVPEGPDDDSPSD